MEMNIESFSFNESFNISKFISLTSKLKKTFATKKYRLIFKLYKFINMNKLDNKIMNIKINLSFYEFFIIFSNILN